MVGGDGFIDAESEGEGSHAGFAGDARGLTGDDGAEEVFELKAQRFGAGKVELLEVEAGGGVGGRDRRRGAIASGDLCSQGWVDSDGEELLTSEVEREVLVRLEEAQLADLLGGDAGGGEVGDGAGGELDADVGDVGLRGEDGDACGADVEHLGLREREDDVEVVDHEVEDDVDVERARGKEAEAVGLKEHGPVEAIDGGSDGGVEAFEVADLHDPVVLLCKGKDRLSLCECGGEGLFDEDVEARDEELRRDRCVMNGGDADAGGVEFEAGGEEIVDGGEGRDVVLRGSRGTGLGAGVYDGGELNAGRGFQLTVDAKVVTAEGPGSNDGGANRMRHSTSKCSGLRPWR